MSNLTLTGAGPEAGGTPFTPTQIAGLQAWYKADAGTSTTTDGVAISQWNDQSGSGSNAAQATGTKQPLFKASIQNGLPVVRFDGVDDHMQAAAVNVAQADTIFLVARNTAADATDRVAIDGSVSRQGLARAGTTDKLRINAGTDQDTLTLWGTASFRQISAVYNGASSTLFADGSAVTIPASPGTNALTGLNIGTFNTSIAFWQGDIAEILIYNSALSTVNRQAVETYLRSKWATP